MTTPPPRKPDVYVMPTQPFTLEEVDFLILLLHNARRNAAKHRDDYEEKLCEQLLHHLQSTEEV